jgi:hypothetical protein
MQMADLAEILNGKSREDVVGALYYASRYIKQANHLSKYEKDIFDDDEKSAPSPDVKRLTWEIVGWVEAKEGLRAGDFDSPTLVRVIVYLGQVSKQFGTELSADELRGAQAAIAGMKIPATR